MAGDGPTEGIGVDNKGAGGYASDCNAYNVENADAAHTGCTTSSTQSKPSGVVVGKDGW